MPWPARALSTGKWRVVLANAGSRHLLRNSVCDPRISIRVPCASVRIGPLRDWTSTTIVFEVVPIAQVSSFAYHPGGVDLPRRTRDEPWESPCRRMMTRPWIFSSLGFTYVVFRAMVKSTTMGVAHGRDF